MKMRQKETYLLFVLFAPCIRARALINRWARKKDDRSLLGAGVVLSLTEGQNAKTVWPPNLFLRGTTWRKDLRLWGIIPSEKVRQNLTVIRTVRETPGKSTKYFWLDQQLLKPASEVRVRTGRVLVPVSAQYGNDCSRKEYDRCVRMADPLLTDPHLIFPDNMDDIDHVCRMWSKFVDCIKSYIDKCFTETRRHQFNKAVESSVDSVHQMCTASSYQTEYLQHAPCLKSTLTEDSHCGRHYKQLVAQVQGPRDMGRGDLCCSHHRFRECVLTETRRACDVKSPVGSKMLASAFSRQILDKALSFLREQCSNYIPNRGDCLGYQPNTAREEEIFQPATSTKSVPTQTIETRYLTNDQVFSDNFQPTVDDRATVNPLSWIPSGRDGRRKTTKTTEFDFGNDFRTTGSSEDTSSRSSYGRGMTWDVTDPSGKDDIFKATHYKPSTESWYPGNNINFHSPEKELNDFSSNQVDEPNQQGLARLDSESGSESMFFRWSAVMFVIPALFLT